MTFTVMRPDDFNYQQRPILLTGSHRSGTTWVGRIISSSREVGYIMEPFNDVNRRKGVFEKQFNRFFPCLNPEEKDEYFESFQKTLTFKYSLAEGFSSIRGLRDSARLLRDFINFSRYRHASLRPFIKDPNALFLAGWLAETFGMQVIVLIRHPAAFVSSILKLGWGHSFSDFLKQPWVFEDLMPDYRTEVQYFSEHEQPLIDQAILLWKILYSVVAEYQRRHPDWLFIRHESLSVDPAHQFASIFSWLQLSFTPEIRQVIDKFSRKDNPEDVTSTNISVSSPKSLMRNTRANLDNWKRRLSSKEICYIRKRAEPVSSLFYTDEDW